MKRIVLTLILLTFAPRAFGELLRTPYPGVRPTGMGNAFLAISDDNNALWYNPAGLARVKDYHVSVIDLSMGVDSLTTLGRLGDALFGGNYNGLIEADKQSMRVGARPTLVMPYFSMALFNQANAFMEMSDIDNLNANVDIYAFNDIGLAMGFGVPLGPYFSIGATGRVFHRTGVDTTLTALDLITELGLPSTDDFMAAAFDHVMELTGAGLGIGVDVGMMASVPLPAGYPRWTLAAVINDLGTTSFRPIGLSSGPPPVPMTFHFGTALEYELGMRRGNVNVAFDFRNAFDNATLIKKLNLGVEYKHRFFALRGGVSQGYPSGGISFQFPPHTRIHFSTYGAELGAGLWQSPQRFYMLQFVVGFNPN